MSTLRLGFAPTILTYGVIRDLANMRRSATCLGVQVSLYTDFGRPSHRTGEALLRAMLLQVFYGVRSERHLMERMEFDLLFRWFAGLGVETMVTVWDHSTFSKNRDRLLEGEIAAKFLNALWRGLEGEAPAIERSFLGGWHAD